MVRSVSNVEMHFTINNNSNTNVDIKFSAHESFLEEDSLGMLQIERLESQIIKNTLETSKPKGLNRVSKICYRCLSMREENLSFN
jgi:hypothetical protein